MFIVVSSHLTGALRSPNLAIETHKADTGLTRGPQRANNWGDREKTVRYLLVEDNADLAEAVVNRLAMDGHAVDHAATLAVARDCLASAGA